jgi:hypothetical protein
MFQLAYLASFSLNQSFYERKKALLRSSHVFQAQRERSIVLFICTRSTGRKTSSSSALAVMLLQHQNGVIKSANWTILQGCLTTEGIPTLISWPCSASTFGQLCIETTPPLLWYPLFPILCGEYVISLHCLILRR